MKPESVNEIRGLLWCETGLFCSRQLKKKVSLCVKKKLKEGRKIGLLNHILDSEKRFLCVLPRVSVGQPSREEPPEG